MSKLTNKTILITGTNRGIGKALLQEVLKLNPSKVYATARNIDSIDVVDQRIEKVYLDLKESDSINAFSSIKDIDIVIHNSGVLAYDRQTSPIDDNLRVNYIGTKELNEILKEDLKEGSKIAFISSVAALSPMTQAKEYSASKAAITSYAESLRNELINRISVHTVYPGPIETDMTKDFSISKADVKETAKQIINGIIENTTHIFPDPYSLNFQDRLISNL